jgi:hypothetical protein
MVDEHDPKSIFDLREAVSKQMVEHANKDDHQNPGLIAELDIQIDSAIESINEQRKG